MTTTETTTTHFARITGLAAIEHVKTHGGQLHKYADPIDGARAVTVAEARDIVSEDPSLVYVDSETPVATGWITYADTSELILTIGVTEAEAIAAAHAIGEDPSGEDYAWLCSAPATARLMTASDDVCIRWRLIDGVADLVE